MCACNVSAAAPLSNVVPLSPPLHFAVMEEDFRFVDAAAEISTKLLDLTENRES